MARKALRVGGIVRVSTDEQKKFGFSIDAQIEKIREWCEMEGHQLVDLYIDEGFTAGNMKRPNLQRMLGELDKLDIVAFTRLDRFSRNVLDANKMLEMFRRNKVSMISIEEDDIDTSTADGMFIFQLKVSLAERELKKGSERIKSVFNYKVSQGQPLTGTLPLGYKVVKHPDGSRGIAKHEREVVEAIFDEFSRCHSIRQTMRNVNDKFGVHKTYNAVQRTLSSDAYTGHFRGNPHYYPAYITQEQFERNQHFLKNNVRVRKTENRSYLFSGMIVCPHCGWKMGATNTQKKGVTYHYYRCPSARINAKCDFSKTMSEMTVEKYLLKHIARIANDYIVEVSEVKPVVQGSPASRISAIKSEMDSLNYLFRKQRIDVESYERDFESLEGELKKLEAVVPAKIDVSGIKTFLNSGWESVYGQMTRESKRSLWKNLIKHIIIDDNKRITDIIFL